MSVVVIGVDPHKRSNTIEVIDPDGSVLAAGPFGTEKQGYRSMLAQGRRCWADPCLASRYWR